MKKVIPFVLSTMLSLTMSACRNSNSPKSDNEPSPATTPTPIPHPTGTISTIAGLQPGATVITEGFTVSRDRAESAESDVVAWLRKMGY